MRSKGAPAQREAVGPSSWRIRTLVAVALALGFHPSEGQAAPPGGTPVIYINSQSFRIPFNVDDETRKKITEVYLYASTDGELSWRFTGKADPESIAFPFKANRDGEFRFAVRTRDRANVLYPPEEEAVSTKMTVIVDTVDPNVRVIALPRRGSQAAVRYEVQDENLDINTLTIEYQAQGASTWRMVQFKRSRSGEARWDAGTGLPLTVRVTVEDKAKNRKMVEQVLPDGLADAPTVQNAGQGVNAPPPIQPIPYQDPDANGSRTDPELAPDPFGQVATETVRPAPSPAPDNPAAAQTAGPRTAPAAPASNGNNGPTPGTDGVRTVGSPRFPIQYEVYEGDANAVAVVEMYGTRDDGASWQLLGTDTDRQSPIQVDVGGPGRVGLYLVVQSANGLGDPRPASGDTPQMFVEVDDAPPQVALDPPQVVSGQGAGSLLITWRAEDPHLDDRPVILSIRPDQPGAIWQQITQPMANSGRYVWPLPTNIPPRFFLRIDVLDTLGNQAAAETTEPVVLQVARPRARILGLDPSARTNVHKIR